ncbi:uncharacterized protein OCT59_013683 [Rhizophagus irregularis]|uniref:uncharacterized protein n=1 Tax=Rhizophagus irregularis TaxID=588596 RepID=UPI001E06950E|nr:hypothetical protein OCT59_013683 [Rhizophagus irregularis]CAG8525257.1 17896_t:CDS:2 [Rhizophagus irregularis]
MVDTHELTKKVIDSLKSKEIYCLRDWIRKFFIQAASGKVNFRSQDEEYISQLKITLDEVQMSIYDFEKLYKMKNESNVEFQDQENTLAEARERFEKMQFSNKMKHYEEPLKKLFEALKMWYR